MEPFAGSLVFSEADDWEGCRVSDDISSVNNDKNGSKKFETSQKMFEVATNKRCDMKFI